MLDNESWLRLLDGLITATKLGKLQWEALGGNGELPVTTKAALMGTASREKHFSARSEGVSYELSSEDPRGRAPYELVVRELGRTRQLKQIGTLRSSVEIRHAQTMRLNSVLEQLFQVVDSSIEPPSAVVSRLLRGLGLD
jgi:hypothetical protein